LVLKNRLDKTKKRLIISSNIQTTRVNGCTFALAMKSKKSIKLKYLPDYNFKLIGIASQVPSFELCYWLNLQLDIDLLRIEDLKYEKKIKTINEFVSAKFPFFYYIDEVMKRKFHIICNKSLYEFESTIDERSLFKENDVNTASFYLIEEAKDINFFLQVFGHFTKREWAILVIHLRKIECITNFKVIEVESLKSKELLIIDTQPT
jgi:hypothetical protein